MTEPDTATDTDIRRSDPPPEHAPQLLRAILDAGNVAFLDEANKRIIAGTPDRLGQVMAILDVLLCVPWGLVAGERNKIMLTRLGRHVARHGSDAGFDDSTTDVNLAKWARGEIEYLTLELLEAVDAYYARIVLDRREALDLLLEKGVVTAAEARKDVVASDPPGPTYATLDLAAWARGQREYLFGEVRQKLRREHGIAVADRRAAVEAILEIGLINHGEARRDV
jgi:hypothetical protein